MSKVVCSVSIELTRVNLGSVAQVVIDRIEDDFGSDTMTMAGVDEQELFDALINNKTFQRLVGEKVVQDGINVCEDPYGYFDAFDFIDEIPALSDIYAHVDAMDDIFQEANKSTEVKRIEVPDGYMLVKIA